MSTTSAITRTTQTQWTQFLKGKLKNVIIIEKDGTEAINKQTVKKY